MVLNSINMKHLIALLLMMGTIQVSAQESPKVYKTSRTVQKPSIDGIPDEDCWKQAEPVTEFIQNLPDEGRPATQPSEVRIIYDDNAIYIGAMLYDSNPDSVLRELGVRDATLNADLFRIGFDTYNNKQDGYFFELYASGVQRDSKQSDLTYNAVWDSKVRILSNGWSLEIKIPYSALRFPSVENQEWGLQITRTIERRKEFAQWALVPKNVNNALIYWGKLTGITSIKAPVRLSVTPFATAYYEKSPYYESEGITSYNKAFSYNFGADLKYGIDEKFTVDLTLLPDFSQVQSDSKVKNLSYREVTYNENRPFFKESTELFQKNQLFYSRRIGKTPGGFYQVSSLLGEGETIRENPSQVKLLNATKISGRNNNGLGIGFLNAVTDNAWAIIGTGDGGTRKILTEPLTNFNVLVLDQQLKHNSSFYFINTNVIRAKQYPDANVTGAGFTYENRKHTWATDASGALSQKITLADSLENNFNIVYGYRYFAGVRKISGKLQFGASHTYINNTYDSRDVGYFVIGNLMKERVYAEYSIYKPNKVFRDNYNALIFDHGVNPETGKTINSYLSLESYFTFLNYSSLDFNFETTPFKTWDYYEPRIAGRYSRTYRYYMFNTGYATDARKAFRLNLNLMYGDFLEMFEGKLYGLISTLRFRASDRLGLRFDFQLINDTYNIGFADQDLNGDIIYGGRQLYTYDNKLSLQYIFKNDMSLSLVARHYWNTGEYKHYYILQPDGEIIETQTYQGTNDFSYNIFNIDLVYSWQFAPGSNFSLVYKNAIETEDAEIIRSFSRNFGNTYEAPQTNSFSLKLFYYLDYNYLKRVKR